MIQDQTIGGGLQKIGELLLALLAVFSFTTLVLYIAGAPPLAAYYHIIKGSLGSWLKLAQVLKVWIPLTLCACGLLYTFRIGLWNIGIEGQMMMGAVFTTLMLRMGMDGAEGLAMIPLAFMAGVIGGAAWALLAGFLKTKGGVNEIFAGLGLNFVAQGIILWLIFGPWKRPGVASMSGTEVFPRELWLTYIPSLNISPAGLLLSLAAVMVTAVIINYTRIGLKLKAVGNNQAAAYLLGLKPAGNMLVAMIFAGGFAGLAGAFQVSGVYHRLIPAISSNYGYLALLVVMLAGFKPWLTPAIAFFFACLNVGSIQLPMMLQIDSSLSGVIQGALVLATLAVTAWRQRSKKEKGKHQNG
jgi:simple sugar transport system permease protein